MFRADVVSAVSVLRGSRGLPDVSSAQWLSTRGALVAPSPGRSRNGVRVSQPKFRAAGVPDHAGQNTLTRPRPASLNARLGTPRAASARTALWSSCRLGPWPAGSSPAGPVTVWREPMVAVGDLDAVRPRVAVPLMARSTPIGLSGGPDDVAATKLIVMPADEQGRAGVRLSELVATLSLLSDLGMGRPMERVLRQTVIAMRLAEAAGVGPEVASATYYTSLVTWVGCATDTSELSELFGDETHLYAEVRHDDLGGLTMAMFVATHLGYGSSAMRRISLVGKFIASGGRSVQQVMESHCQAASDFAERLELGESVCAPLVQAFERWDGKGVPGRVGTG